MKILLLAAVAMFATTAAFAHPHKQVGVPQKQGKYYDCFYCGVQRYSPNGTLPYGSDGGPCFDKNTGKKRLGHIWFETR